MDIFKQNKKKGFDFLINQIQKALQGSNNPTCAIFLGAGCSISSSIPSAFDITEICKKLSFIDNCRGGHEIDKENNYEIDRFIENRQLEFGKFVSDQDIELKRKLLSKKDYLIGTIPENYKSGKTKDELWEQFKNLFLADSQYGHWFEVYSENPRERQALIERIIGDKKPKGAYIYLSYLINQGKFKNIFTTNFDDLLNDALIQYAEIKARVIAHNELAKFIDIESKKPNIIKLHGDFLFENIKNTSDETSELEKNLQIKLGEALQRLNLIVIGYNGADYSVINALQKIKSEKEFGLYWCGSDEKRLNWRVKQLIADTPNSFFIKVESFEKLIAKTWQALKDESKAPNIEDISVQRTRDRDDFLAEYVRDLEETKALPKAEINEMKESNKRIKERKSNQDIINLPSDEKRKYFDSLRIDAVGRKLKDIQSELGRECASELFEIIDHDDFFERKIRKALIEHISNALSNLKEVDGDRTKKILDAVPDEIIIEKIKRTDPSKFNSALGELNAVSQRKVGLVSKKVTELSSNKIINSNLKEFMMLLPESDSGSSLLILKDYSDEFLYTKFKSGSLNDIALTFSRINKASKERARRLFKDYSNIELINKIESSPIERVGQALSIFEKIDHDKTSRIFGHIGIKYFEEKLSVLTLRDFSSVLNEFYLVDKKIANKLYGLYSNDFILGKCKSADFNEIANSFVKLSKINIKKTGQVFDSIESDLLISKINSSKPDFDSLGASFLNFQNLNFNNLKLIAKHSNLVTKATLLAKDAVKSKEQAFVSYIAIYLETDFELGAEIIKNMDSTYFINLYNWLGLEQYVNILPTILKAFKKNNMLKESDAMAKYISYISNQ